MKVYPVKNPEGREIGFEIENIYANPKTIAKLLGRIPEVTNICTQKLFDSSENRLEFKYKGVDCVVWEPFGDNSRYWIGSKNPGENNIEVGELKEVFESYTPPFLIKIVGDILSLKFLGLNK